MKVATKMKDLPRSPTGAVMALYRLSPPMDGHEFVIVSSVIVPCSGPETYIFPADHAGLVVDYGELSGSQRGIMDHVAVLTDAGYEVENGDAS